MSSHTIVNRLSAGPVTHLRISGVIDETFNPQPFMRELVGHIILDLGRVERISSFGVRKWIEFTNQLPPGTAALYVVHAPPLVVDQLNMVEGFAGVTQVLSVLAPYTCNRCGEDRLRLVDLQAEAAIIAEGKAPPHSCPVCQSPLQFADLPAEFFDYARHQKLSPLDQSVVRYLKTLQPSEQLEASEVAAHVKLVHEDITYFRISNVLRADLNVRRLAAGLEGRVVYDFGNVVSMEEGAGARLVQAFETAAQNAKVFLWRVPPMVLSALAQVGKPPAAALCTFYLPCECRNCGSKGPQRFDAALYVKALGTGATGERPCLICGGKARVSALRELAPFLASCTLAQARIEEIEALEPRALSQYLSGAASHDASSDQKPGDTGAFGSSLKLQILRRIGQGGMAEVFLARQVGLKGFEKYVVMKKILENFAQQPDFVEMLFAEARANARLTHQNIVQTFDVGMMNGVAYITMEYVRGPDVKRLTTLLRKAGMPMPVACALRIVAETAAGLHYAHSYVDPTGKPHPMVHRDVSPHNILLSLDGAIKLSDFGIAKVQGEADNTRPGTFKGKIAYLSPEVIAGMSVDVRSDVFALGVTLFELLTGKLPFRRENEAATLHAIMREPAPRVSKLNPEVPEDVAELCARALEKDPVQRIQSAGELREELESIMTRHRLNVSPTAVAQFFQERLGAQLAEYAPSAAGSGSGSGQSSTGVPRPSAQSGSGASPAKPSAQSGSGASPAKPSAQSGSGNSPAKHSAPSSSGVFPPKPSAQSRSGQTQKPPELRGKTLPKVSPPPAPPSEPILLMDEVTEPPSDKAAPRRQTSEVRPLQQAASPPTVPVRVAAPPPAVARAPAAAPARAFSTAPALAELGPPPQISEPITLVAPVHRSVQPAPAATPYPAPMAGLKLQEPEASYKGWVIGGAVLAISVLAIVGVMMNRGKERSEVYNLEPDENLYIAGVRVDPGHLRLPPGTGTLIVSTAREGKLYRLGTSPREGGIDARSLVQVHPGSDTGDLHAPLSVASEPSGCPVQVGGERLSSATPVQASIEAGKELLVEVTCPGYTWSQWVMAASGQTVEVAARPSPR